MSARILLALALTLPACVAEAAPDEQYWPCPPICPTEDIACQAQRPSGGDLTEDANDAGSAEPAPVLAAPTSIPEARR